MEAILAAIGGSSVASIIITVLAIGLAIKISWFTVKKVVLNIVMGGIVYLFATEILMIPMDPGFWAWGLTVLFGPVPMAIYAIWTWL